MNQPIHAVVVLELHRRRRGARRHRGRRAEPGDARAQHRGAPGRHPGLDHARRLRPRDERHGHAVRGHRRRRASRCSTTSRRPSSPRSPRRRRSRWKRRSRPRPSSIGEDGEPIEPRGREGEAPRRRPRAPPARRPSRPPRTTRAEALLVHPGRLAGRRARQPRARPTRTPRTTPASSVADALVARWDLPKPKKKFAGELTEGRTGPGGPRVARAQAADVHERVGPLGRARARLLQARARPHPRHPRRDRPGVRRHPGQGGRRARRPQRAQVAQARARRRRSSCACASASAGPTRRTPTSSPATSSARGASPRRRCAS